MKISVMIKKLSNPRVRWRLKVAFCVYGIAIILGLLGKIIYDIGYFNAQALEKDKNTKRLSTAYPIVYPLITIESAQRIVSGALKEDPTNPKTIVNQIVDYNYKLSTIIVENNKIKNIAWIIEMRLFFIGDLLNTEGYNLTEGVKRQHNINNANY